MTSPNAHLPGRLGDPQRTLASDPRADPRLVAAFEAMGGFAPGVPDLSADADYETGLAHCLAAEQALEGMHGLMRDAMPDYGHIEQYTETIDGPDGNPLSMYVHRPKQHTGALPALVHTHGGGMVMMTAADPNFVRWRNDLAAAGLLVVGVEFRNGGGRLGNHPFPAGLNDCAVGLQWVHANRQALGLSGIVISGESGGGNLSIATTLKARREGWLEAIDGVYAQCPYISGQYAEPPGELLSLYENDGYLLSCAEMGGLARVYDPSGRNARNPLAWPLHAEPADLSGLPAHVISVNELDPLRDEGLAYYRKLLAAGVPSVARTVHGTPHAGDQSFPDLVPEVYQATIRSIAGFARAVSTTSR